MTSRLLMVKPQPGWKFPKSPSAIGNLLGAVCVAASSESRLS
jgi:hypothetical protein